MLFRIFKGLAKIKKNNRGKGEKRRKLISILRAITLLSYHSITILPYNNRRKRAQIFCKPVSRLGIFIIINQIHASLNIKNEHMTLQLRFNWSILISESFAKSNDRHMQNR